jgi:hypothetical protein
MFRQGRATRGYTAARASFTDGLGQGINELLAEAVNPSRAQMIRGQPYFGSARVEDPEADLIGDGRTNAERRHRPNSMLS